MIRRLSALLPFVAIAGCYSADGGTAPPSDQLYFPVGLSVSSGGNVLYAINSDFDLQWSGGTVQSFDLNLIRKHAVLAIANPTDLALPLVERPATPGVCPDQPRAETNDGTHTTSGETCAPPVSASFYIRDSVTVGAFATDLQLLHGTRLFSPVRGNASLTWIDVAKDDPNVEPPVDRAVPYAPFILDCGVRVDGRCDQGHLAGTDPNEAGNSRHLTTPGEPFGMAISEDGSAISITHQTDTKTSLFSTGLDPKAGTFVTPSLQFIVDSLPTGGTGIAAIPHCLPGPDGNSCAVESARPSFLETSRAVATVTLLRYYSDDGIITSSIRRPYLLLESTVPLAANSVGTDSRGIAIDRTPRVECALHVAPASASRTDADVKTDLEACNRVPARVFIANRTPASLVVGELGGTGSITGATFDPDRLTITDSIPLSNGPSSVYLAPIVDTDGRYSLRVFVTCFDSAVIYVYNPDTRTLENIIRTAPGPFAMAFDPVSEADIAQRAIVPKDSAGISRFRFGYVASFTQSYIQVLDLDNSLPAKSTFERFVLAVGAPTFPKGTF